jgi:ABC-type transport system involved in multi-copper enzyme maturation permease subunit
MLEKLVAISTVLSVICVAILLNTTTPATIGPLGIFVLFILLYVSVLGVLTFLLFGIHKIVRRILQSLGVKRPVDELTFRKAYYFSSVVALTPVMMIGLQSVGEVGIYELLLLALFTVIACTYVSKRMA